MQIEAVLLTGGASRRMGQDKAEILFEGQRIGKTLAERLRQTGYPTTILGRQPIEGFPFFKDQDDYAGPLVALSRFNPLREAVFVCACDLPNLDPALVFQLAEVIGRHEAAIPKAQEQLQPACALYRASAWDKLPTLIQAGKRSLMAWIDLLDIIVIGEEDLERRGIDTNSLRGFNTPEELEALKRQETTS